MVLISPNKEALRWRKILRFPEAVKKYFAFLSEQEFHCAQEEPTFVRFESEKFFVNVFHGRISYEIGLEFGRKKILEELDNPYGLSEVIELNDPKKASEYRPYATRTKEGVEEGVQQLALLFKQYLLPMLPEINPQVYRTLQKQRQEWGHQLELEVRSHHVRPEAEAASKQKNYEKVVQLYESIKEALSPAELKKLAYAKKQVVKD